jgi:hypothetical protein
LQQSELIQQLSILINADVAGLDRARQIELIRALVDEAARRGTRPITLGPLQRILIQGREGTLGG